MNENFNILVHKLNTFKFKYYSFKLIKGLIITFFLLILIYTIFSIIEYFFFLNTDVRKFFFFGFLIFSVLMFTQFVVLPILRMIHLLKPIDTKSITYIIQQHFKGIEDKLLNIIELNELPKDQYSKELVLASIDQKIEKLKVFDFNEAIQYKNLKNIVFYLAVSSIFSLSVIIINKDVFIESTKRLVHYNTTFTKPAPFKFTIINDDLKVKKGESFTLKVKVNGDELPEIVYINIDGNNYLMKSATDFSFEYELVSVINPVSFYFTDLKYNSEKHYLELLPKPGITNFKTTVYPPIYTGIQNQVIDNLGDLQVPNGTKVEWNFNGIDIDSVFITLGDSVKLNAIKKDNQFIINSIFYKSTSYNVFIQNKVTKPELALSYSVEVIPDLFPEITVKQIADSMQLTRFFFKGNINDDYGFSNLDFHFNVNNEDSAISIPFVKLLPDQEFYFSFDFNDLLIKEGIVSYYFSVTDNDVINNYKTTTSDNFSFQFPSNKEIMAKDREDFKELEKKLEKSQKLAGEIRQDINNLQMKNMDSNLSEWESPSVSTLFGSVPGSASPKNTPLLFSSSS